MNRPQKLALMGAGIAIVGALSVAASKTLFAATISLPQQPPPLVATRRPVILRRLPNSKAEAVSRITAKSPLYVRCHDGHPLVYGPWVGVIDAPNDRIGWVDASLVSAAAGQCEAAHEAPSRWRLRRIRVTDNAVVVRFGPSQKTLALARAMSGRVAWTDGRFAIVGGQRWIPVLLDTGSSGWVRSDLVQTRGVFR